MTIHLPALSGIILTYLLVFHTTDISQMRTSLTANGVNFSGRKLGLKEIGYTIRFTDPSGNRYCLYEPSEEVLTWSSGPRAAERGNADARRWPHRRSR